jgi:hypothetical protein
VNGAWWLVVLLSGLAASAVLFGYRRTVGGLIALYAV